MSLKPPLITKFRCGKSFFKLKTQSYFKGGIVRFYFGSSPCKWALRACMMNLVTPPCSLTILMNSMQSSHLSFSSTPSLHFTVTGIVTYLRISATILATNSGLNIRIAPKQPSLVLLLGHPQFTFTSS